MKCFSAFFILLPLLALVFLFSFALLSFNFLFSSHCIWVFSAFISSFNCWMSSLSLFLTSLMDFVSYSLCYSLLHLVAVYHFVCDCVVFETSFCIAQLSTLYTYIFLQLLFLLVHHTIKTADITAFPAFYAFHFSIFLNYCFHFSFNICISPFLILD